MGLGNHKRKMSISLSITLMLPHTVEELGAAESTSILESQGREQEVTLLFSFIVKVCLY